MGFGFPTGMKLVMALDPRPTPWFWGVNGAVSVLAAGIAVVSRISFPIDTTICIGGVCYLVLMPTALLLIAKARPALLKSAFVILPRTATPGLAMYDLEARQS